MSEMQLIKADRTHFEQLWPTFKYWMQAVGSLATKEDAEKEYEKILSEGVMFFISYGDDVGGFICGRVCFHFWLNEKAAHEYLWYVSPFYRGEGFGKMLIAAFEAWAKANDCKAVIITPNHYGSDNPDKPKEVLASVGYDCYGFQMRKEFQDV